MAMFSKNDEVGSNKQCQSIGIPTRKSISVSCSYQVGSIFKIKKKNIENLLLGFM